MPDDSKLATPVTEATEAFVAPRPKRRRLLRRVLMTAGPLAVLLVGGFLYLNGGRYAGTDNAYVHTHMITVSADISGRVVGLQVKENQHVAAGDVLFQLDPEPLQIAVDRARADLESTRNEIIGLKAAYAQRQEDLKAAESTAGLNQRELKRREKLVADKIISQSDYDEARNNYDVASRQVAGIHQDISRITSELGGDPNIAPEDHPKYKAAQSTLAQAELDQRRGTVKSPASGIVAQVDSLRPGDYINAGAPVFNIVSDNDAWIEANLKETDLTYVKPGQTAEITIDTYPGRTFEAVVDSIGMATGAEFSVLPAQNASGNWVKVVQRIPVRLHVTDAPQDAVLRAGMSAVVEIDTGHRRALLGMLSHAFAGDSSADQAQ
jgi:membrane fusion protein (multidrug efflux system)